MGSSDVRHAVIEDRNAVINLLRESHAAARFNFPFSAPHANALFMSHVENGLALVCGSPVNGLLMAMAFDHPFGAGLWAKETVWYISPADRGSAALRMLDAYEAWARERGCVTICMASLATNDVSRIYERKGYSPAETHFTKAVN